MTASISSNGIVRTLTWPVLGLTKNTKKRFANSWRPVSSRIQASTSPKTVRFVGSLRTFCTTASTVGCTARSVTPCPQT